MPLYAYEHDRDPRGKCQPRFEMLQTLSAQPLAHCPDCGRPCHRVIAACSIQGSSSAKERLAPSNLEKHGFTQYKRAGGGFYEKTCGQGPKVIKRR